MSYFSKTVLQVQVPSHMTTRWGSAGAIGRATLLHAYVTLSWLATRLCYVAWLCVALKFRDGGSMLMHFNDTFIYRITNNRRLILTLRLFQFAVCSRFDLWDFESVRKWYVLDLVSYRSRDWSFRSRSFAVRFLDWNFRTRSFAFSLSCFELPHLMSVFLLSVLFR